MLLPIVAKTVIIALCLMITFHTVNMKCNEECWMLCDDRLNIRVSSDGQRITLLGLFIIFQLKDDKQAK